ncbi:catalase [Trichonephila clavipes]|nr:catalase [Trichonephila clavipes]
MDFKSIALTTRPRLLQCSVKDGLVHEGSHKDSTRGSCLTFSETATRVKQNVSSSWKQAPLHEWYEGNHPSAALLGTGSRRDETTLARFRSGHTRAQWHVVGLKVYPSCPNCNVTQCAPARIMACIGCHNSCIGCLHSSSSTVLQCLKTHGFMGLV